ncbi:hypothetical protein DFH27DRAFT_487818 [Peziza echinospora]|nr:hypothetical protein DFH27DRAFT_487818 [Peziza echinospora]
MVLHIPTYLAPLAKANLTETPHILAKHARDGATSASVLLTEAHIPHSLDADDCPNFPQTTIRVVPTDSLSAAISILAASASADEDAPLAKGKTVVLNSCSDKSPGGRYAELPLHVLSNTTQEESLCLATSLYTTLNPAWYPWANTGETCVRGIYSPGVVIFRDPRTLQMLPRAADRHVVSVLSLAPPSQRPLDPATGGSTYADESDLAYLRRKLRFWLRTAATNGQERLVLGAWGCGGHGCPRRLVAEEMKRALGEREFKGWFYEVVFAITPRDGGGREEDGSFVVFKEVLDGVVL